MSDITMLEAMSIEELRSELAEREDGNRGLLAASAGESLRNIDDATIIHVLRGLQRAIYGVDDRKDLWELPRDDPMRLSADSVAAVFETERIVDNGDGTSTLAVKNFGTSFDLCPEERFREQPVGAFCTGFLVAPDIIATAGHAVQAREFADMSFVFGFEMMDHASSRLVIRNDEIYRWEKVIDHRVIRQGPDWALVRIDRPVGNHKVLKIRREGKIENGQAVYVIGHPSGLPKKAAGGAAVRDNEAPAIFTANTDTYTGNSGSPVFNSLTNEVEGVLARGETDFVRQGNCRVSLVCPVGTKCRGEDCTRTTEFASLVP
ncbi:MAG: serine protease [Pseudomonadota bacterium]